MAAKKKPIAKNTNARLAQKLFPSLSKKQAIEAARILHTGRDSPIDIVVKYNPTTHEGGSDHHASADYAIDATVMDGSRYDVASKLHQMADLIVNTMGMPIKSAYIVVGLRKA